MFTTISSAANYTVTHKEEEGRRMSLLPKNRQKIRRNSYSNKGGNVFFRQVSKKEINQIILTAKRLDNRTRAVKGAKNGCLGYIAIEILEYFGNLINLGTGRLEPSIDHLCNKLTHSRDGIVQALKRLKRHRFIEWTRRYEETGQKGRGVQKKQITNAYRLYLPNIAKQILEKFGFNFPISDDLQHEQNQKFEQMEEWINLSSFEEQAQMLVEDEKMAEVLARLGKLFDNKRESVIQ